MAIKRAGRQHSWHFILADLALILFLLALTGLPLEAEVAGTRRKESRNVPAPQIAPAQALFRPLPGGPSLSAWLASQPRDARATLTIFASFAPGGEAAAWQASDALAREAAAAGVAVRAIIARGEEADLYASLAYDAPLQSAS
ncbi:MAG: hypothetical protein ACK4IS_12490 [Erythrobacter sp.]